MVSLEGALLSTFRTKKRGEFSAPPLFMKAYQARFI
jgi:hypothetical protein